MERCPSGGRRTTELQKGKATLQACLTRTRPHLRAAKIVYEDHVGYLRASLTVSG
jgi:hypothetical protein